MSKNVKSLICTLRKLTTTTNNSSSAAETVAAAETSLIKEKESNIFNRIMGLGYRKDANAAETLNDWVEEGNIMKKRHLINIIIKLRNRKKHKHAFQVMDWWRERGNDLSPGDHAIHLDLLSKIEGVDAAEKYFERLPEHARNKLTYGALLHCYCKENMLEKAMTLLEKMRELNYASTPLVYNNLMSMLVSMGKPGSVPPLITEMKNKGILPDIHTYTCLLDSYALLKDTENAERVLSEMKEAGVKCDWNTYTSLASIYVKEGIIDKANSALKEVENMDKFRDRKAYHILLTLYSAISNKLGVYQVWESLKLTFPETTNINYHFMLQALSRLGDTDGLEKYFEEWESSYTLYDIRLTNILIDSYLERDMIEEAEKLREDAVKKGAEPNVGTLMKFMRFYLHKHQMKLACKYFEEATLKVKVNHWKASQETVSLFLNYFEEEKDADGAEYFCKLLKNINSLPADVYSSLSRTYVAAGMMESQIHDRLKANGIEIGA